VHSVLLVGVPRGGTTWVGQVLGHTQGATYVHEPDGTHDPFAFRAKLKQFNQPMLDADGPRSAAPDLAALFDGALAGGAPAGTLRDRVARYEWNRMSNDEKLKARRTGRLSARLRLALKAAAPRVAVTGIEHVVVKSVNSVFCVEWIARHCTPSTVGVVSRHPLNVVASWRDFGWTTPYGPQYRAMRARARERWHVDLPPPDASDTERAAAVAGMLGYTLFDACRRQPTWVHVSHDELCVDAAARFPAVATQLGLEWTDSAAGRLAGADRPGEGYAINRVTADQPDRWRTRLGAAENATACEVLQRFPDAPWLSVLR
jgi:hypothetical protein